MQNQNKTNKIIKQIGTENGVSYNSHHPLPIQGHNNLVSHLQCKPSQPSFIVSQPAASSCSNTRLKHCCVSAPIEFAHCLLHAFLLGSPPEQMALAFAQRHCKGIIASIAQNRERRKRNETAERRGRRRGVQNG